VNFTCFTRRRNI